ncbi:methyl-accepting chemotaxis protein [Clostridium bornimense]|nr:methyl-accepting chemotaxis protein [Clostridium bornimense]
MESYNLLEKNNRKIDEQLYKVSIISSIMLFIDFVFVLSNKGLKIINYRDMTFFVASLILIYPILYYKLSNNKENFKKVVIYTFNGACIIGYLTMWVLMPYILIGPLLIAGLYYDSKLAKNILVFDIILMILCNALQPVFFGQYSLHRTYIETTHISVYFTIQLIVVGALVIYNAENSKELLINSLESNKNLESMIRNTNELVNTLNNSLCSLSSSVSDSQCSMEYIRDTIQDISSNSGDILDSVILTDDSLNDIISDIDTTLSKNEEIHYYNFKITNISNKIKGKFDNILPYFNNIKVSIQNSKDKVDSLQDKAVLALEAIKLDSLESNNAIEYGTGFMEIAEEIKVTLTKITKEFFAVINEVENSTASFDKVFSVQYEIINHLYTIHGIMNNLHSKGFMIKDNMNNLKEMNENINEALIKITKNIESLNSNFIDISNQVNHINDNARKIGNYKFMKLVN